MSATSDSQGAGRASGGSATPLALLEKLRAKLGGAGAPPPPPRPPGSEEDEEEDGMLRMSFLEHLQELRTRIIRALMGLVVAAVVSLSFSSYLWNIVRQPATAALTSLGVNPPVLHILTPMEGFNIIWFWMPVLCAIFIASPWILYQVWAFISPGLYRRERRFALPFILCSAGLFLTGGAFAYFVVFRYALTFLLGIGMGNGVEPVVSVTSYFELFVNVMLGVALVFELPVLIFFLTLLRLASPGFLLRHSRYAILAIFIIAAIVTPTPDVFNLMLFAVPMCMLFYVGIFASYILVLQREGRKFPWSTVLKVTVVVLLVAALAIYIAVTRYGYHLVSHWPLLVR
ncbi:MAG TPA: twin-arginine translocase subunit TatC [Bryobacteraceae bacterium]|nr:twin-arginine translocase subunit TatC [Bryobacteraceae bacterium]